VKQPAIDAQFEVAFTVREADLASHVSPDPADQFPAVFATSRMVAFMELAAAHLLDSLLEPGQLSVGAAIETTHIAATPVGARIRAVARYLGAEGKLYRFEVVAYDAAGEIGRGTHRRAIVSLDRLLSSAARRIGAAP
jgi:predicted thioesterase